MFNAQRKDAKTKTLGRMRNPGHNDPGHNNPSLFGNICQNDPNQNGQSMKKVNIKIYEIY